MIGASRTRPCALGISIMVWAVRENTVRGEVLSCLGCSPHPLPPPLPPIILHTGQESVDVQGVLDGGAPLDVLMTAHLRLRGRQQGGGG